MVLIHSLLRGRAKIGPDMWVLSIQQKFRFEISEIPRAQWNCTFQFIPVEETRQYLISCWTHQKLKALIPREHSSFRANEPPSLPVFFIFLRYCGRKLCLNMCHGNSENSDDCLYLRIFLIYGTNVSVSQSRIPLQVVAFWFTNKRMQVEILSMLKHGFHLKV